jgi:hypothetical protein
MDRRVGNWKAFSTVDRGPVVAEFLDAIWARFLLDAILEFVLNGLHSIAGRGPRIHHRSIARRIHAYLPQCRDRHQPAGGTSPQQVRWTWT